MTLIKKIQGKYSIVVPFMMIYYGKEIALDKIYCSWQDSFNLLYTFKVEVEKACPRSVVEIDSHTVEYKVSGKTMKKECFGRVFISFKPCWKGFLVRCMPYLVEDATTLVGCMPYLVEDATTLNGRFR
jgi:hypothetical protein